MQAHALDEDPLDGHTPLLPNFRENRVDFKSDGLALYDHTLYCAGTNDVTQGGLGTLNKSLSEISDTECRAVGVCEIVVSPSLPRNKE